MDKDIFRILVKMAVKQARTITDDEEALGVQLLYPRWKIGKEYEVGQYVQYNDTLYKVLTAHTSQADWTPDVSPSLFANVLTSLDGTSQEWVQPDSTNAYMKGDRVIFEGNIYESLIDNNIWSPTAYPAGWQLLEG